jgi:hypothetical protein
MEQQQKLELKQEQKSKWMTHAVDYKIIVHLNVDVHIDVYVHADVHVL